MNQKPPNADASPAKPLWQALQLAWELGYLIIIPLLVFGLGGRWLDRQFGTSPWLLLGGMILAVVLTTVFLVRKFSKLIHQMNNEIPKQVRDDRKENTTPDGR